MDHTSQESKPPTETNSETKSSSAATSNPPIKDECEDEGDETDAVLAVVAAVEQATKSGDVKTSASHSTPVKRKHPPSRSSSTSTPTSASVSGGGGGSPSSSAGNLSDSAKRRKKDPSAPKAPLNGYLVYFNEERAGMRAQNPNIGFGELTKIIAAKWKELPTEQKQKYINEADQDKERYEKEMASYKKSDAYKQFLKGTLFFD